MTIDEDALAEAYNLGLEHEKAGRKSEAISYYLKCLDLDPDDHGGVEMRLASLGHAANPQKASSAYVATLFDQHADAFDDILVGQLGYDVPALIKKCLLEMDFNGPFDRKLALVCGAGLAGEQVEEWCSELVAVDLAENMVTLAAERGCYDDLYIADVTSFLLESDEDPFHLIIAADVFPYLGDLTKFCAGLQRMLLPGGVFAFSTETQPMDCMQGREFCVGPHQRFAHAPTYIDACLEEAGMKISHREDIVVRMEKGHPVSGELVIAQMENSAKADQ